MDHNFEDDEDDSRKPAARLIVNSSTTTATSQLDVENKNNDNNETTIPQESDVVRTTTGEIPFLITHWLAGLKDAEKIDDMQIELSSERVAAMAKIQNAAQDLAIAFQTLGAFGKIMKVRGEISLNEKFRNNLMYVYN
jgi:hypothetical protein